MITQPRYFICGGHASKNLKGTKNYLVKHWCTSSLQIIFSSTYSVPVL